MTEIADFKREEFDKGNILRSAGSLIGENLVYRFRSPEEDVSDKVYFGTTPCLILYLEPRDLKKVMHETEKLEAIEISKFISTLPIICKFGSYHNLQNFVTHKLFRKKNEILRQDGISDKVFVVLEGIVRIIRYNKPESITDIAFEEAQEFEDHLMLAEEKFSNLPPMTVIRDLSRGGVLNLGNLIRHKKCMFSVVVESEECEIAEIDGPPWLDVLIDAGWTLSDLANFECDVLDKLEKKLPSLLTQLYGDPQKQQESTKRDKIINEIKDLEGLKQQEQELEKIPEPSESVDKEPNKKSVFPDLSRGTGSKHQFSTMDESKGYREADESLFANSSLFASIRSQQDPKGKLKKTFKNVALARKALKLFSKYPDSGDAILASDAELSKKFKSDYGNSVSFLDSKSDAFEKSTMMSQRCRKHDQMTPIGQEYLERNDSIHKLDVWKKDVLKFKKDMTSKVFNVASKKNLKGGKSDQPKPTRHEILPKSEEIKGRLGGPVSLQKVLDPDDPFRRFPVLNTLMKRKQEVTSRHPSRETKFKTEDLDYLLLVMKESSNITRQTIKTISSTKATGKQAQAEKSVMQRRIKFERDQFYLEKAHKVRSLSNRPY